MIPDPQPGITASRPSDREHSSDDAIVQRIRAGETHLYEVILRRYNQRLFRSARSLLGDDALAQDAVQEAYVAAYLRLDSYMANGTFGAWLTQIAINEARMSRRKTRRRTEIPITEAPDELLADRRPRNDPAQEAANRQLVGLIEGAVDRLPEAYRVVFVLRGIQQLSVAETAASLGIPPATVKTRFHRARNLLQLALAPDIQAAGLQAFEFAGRRCDRMVATVMQRLGAPWGPWNSTAKLQ